MDGKKEQRWTYCYDGHGGICVEDEDHRQVALVRGGKEDKARLIAASPDIIAVLCEADEYLSHNPLNQIGSGSILHKKMRAAIQKAQPR